MNLIAAPADRRFRRAHVKPARRRGGWRRVSRTIVRYGLLTLAAAYGFYRTGGFVAQARVLRIDRIVVEGNERLSDGEVLAVLTGLHGEHIIWADLGAWRRRLLASPWVQDAALKRSLPSMVEVKVWERAPMALGRINGELYLVDPQGVILDEYAPRYADLDLPLVDGLTTTPGELAPDKPRAELAARLIASLAPRPAVAQRLSQIDVSDLANAAVILTGDPTVIHVGDDRFLQRLQSYLDLSEALHARVPKIDSVDVRFDNRIYVRPAGTTVNASSQPASAVGR